MAPRNTASNIISPCRGLPRPLGLVTDDPKPTAPLLGASLGLAATPTAAGVAMRSAILPATIDRSVGENCDTLLRTCSAPKTASTISCTVAKRAAGSLAIARLIAEQNGSGMPV